ncbi:MAG: phosphatidate cytidylyltransferase, partial [Bradyrhizobium canariense]
MSEREAASAAPAEQGARNLLRRVLAALVLAPAAIALAYAGGLPWAALVTLTAIGLYLEWLMIIGLARELRVTVPGIAALAIAGICLAGARLDAALVTLGIGVAVVVLLSPQRRNWSAAGLFYAGSAEVASILLRLDALHG